MDGTGEEIRAIMVMLCWFYCIPFMKMLYYASAFLLAAFALFMLRRGIFRARIGLRQVAFSLLFVAAVKFWVFDLRDLDHYLVCGTGFRAVQALCTPTGFKVIEVVGLLGLCATSYLLFHFYRVTLRNKPPRLVPPEQMGIRRLANVTMALVIGLICWTLAPWVGTLIAGEVPAVLLGRTWQYWSLVCVGLLLTGFWRAENCDWTGSQRSVGAARQRAMGIKVGSHAAAAWTPRDTLWMAVFLFLITLALSYAGHDVLGK